jgi:hypothetical protein
MKACLTGVRDILDRHRVAAGFAELRDQLAIRGVHAEWQLELHVAQHLDRGQLRRDQPVQHAKRAQTQHKQEQDKEDDSPSQEATDARHFRGNPKGLQKLLKKSIECCDRRRHRNVGTVGARIVRPGWGFRSDRMLDRPNLNGLLPKR